MIRSAFCAATLLALTATAAPALEVVKAITVAAPPDKVWDTIGNFCGIGDWHPAIENCEASMQDGKPIRKLTLKGGGGTIVETELSRSDDKMSYSYAILDGPLPVAGYISTLAVTPGGEGSRVTWFGVFEAKGADDAKATATIAGIYEAGLASLAEKAKAAK
ncbi:MULTISPECIES: SRPBCC family protein [Methylobacterium]|uniref:IS1595 family transposase ISMpo2 n=1 Tax=Methylobacterium thuringiense TaxID=1003091 RepID=A0ABQ4TNB7_9HYPH|nr:MULTISPECIES: SRPBCC family protein [Methylobacterium]TXN23721.1 SRPBCC family protein [Methylobacterium sp. WL9]GJE56133.1 IS1595 family transposase ISMpo2 [Methylobacterium thuringiense]